MPRTTADIAYTDAEAARIRYIAPPSETEPTGRVFEDPAWTALVDFFDQHIPIPHGWYKAVLIYVSRRFDTPIPTAYLELDSWAAGQFRRLDVQADPDAVHAYGN